MSDFASAGYDNTPNFYLEGQETGGYTTLSNEALADKISVYEAVLAQDGVNPRAVASARKVLSYLSFERQSRAGAFNKAIARQVIAAADGEVLQTEDGEIIFSLEIPDEVPSGLVTHEN